MRYIIFCVKFNKKKQQWFPFLIVNETSLSVVETCKAPSSDVRIIKEPVSRVFQLVTLEA